MAAAISLADFTIGPASGLTAISAVLQLLAERSFSTTYRTTMATCRTMGTIAGSKSGPHPAGSGLTSALATTATPTSRAQILPCRPDNRHGRSCIGHFFGYRPGGLNDLLRAPADLNAFMASLAVIATDVLR